MSGATREISLDDLRWSDDDATPPTPPKPKAHVTTPKATPKATPTKRKREADVRLPTPTKLDAFDFGGETLSDSDSAKPSVAHVSPRDVPVPRLYPKPKFTPISTSIAKKHHATRAPVKKERFNLSEYLKMIGLGTGAPGLATGVDLSWRGLSRKRQRNFINK